jgi:hypothetical protein
VWSFNSLFERKDDEYSYLKFKYKQDDDADDIGNYNLGDLPKCSVRTLPQRATAGSE